MNSLRTKFTAWYTAITTLIVITFAIFSYWLLYINIFEQLRLDFISSGQNISGDYIINTEDNIQINSDPNNTTLSEFLQEENLSLRIIDQDKNILVQFGAFKKQIKPSQTKINSALLADKTSLAIVEGAENKKLFYYVAPIVKDDITVGVIELSQPLANTFSALEQLLYILTMGVIITIIIGLISGYYLSRNILRYVDILVNKVEEISEHKDFALRLPVPTDYEDELTRLAGLFNEMLSKLQTVYQREKNFTANVSHDLRTPLTIIQGNVDLALKKKDLTPSQTTKVLGLIKKEVKRISGIIEAMLELNAIETGKQNNKIVSINVPELIDSIVDNYRLKTLPGNVEVIFKKNKLAPSHNMIGNYDLVKRVLTNLIDNAIKYNRKNGQVILKTFTLHRQVFITILDTGPGIDKKDLPYIFDRHYQATKSQTSVKTGFGLGLAIVREIIHLHRGKIQIKSTKGQGTKVKIIFPQAK